MAKDWRTAVCVRYRLALVLLSVAISWVLLGTLSHIPITTVRKYRELRMEKKVEQLKVGMAEKELTQIMGEPVSETTVTTEGMSREIRQDHTHLRRLEYWPLAPIESGAFRSWVVYLDDKDGNILHVSPEAGLVEVDYSPMSKLMAGGTMLVLALLVWWFVQRWCRRSPRKQDYYTER